MKSFLLLTLGTLLLSSCAESTDTHEAKSEDKVYNLDPYNDEMTIFYADNKTVKQTFEMQDSLKHGKAVQFYDTGEINTVMYFENDLKKDTAIYYRRNGSIYRKTPYVADEKDGVQIGYYENGDIMFEMPYNNGRPLAGLKEYTEAGELVEEPKIVFEKNGKGGYDVSIAPKRTKVEFYNVSSSSYGKETRYTTNGQIESKRGKCSINSKRQIGAKIYTSNRACYLIFGTPK